MTQNRKVTHSGKRLHKRFDRETGEGIMPLTTKGEPHERTE